jgi:hypothetical protein
VLRDKVGEIEDAVDDLAQYAAVVEPDRKLGPSSLTP